MTTSLLNDSSAAWPTAIRTILRPGREQRYDLVHRAIPEDLVEAFLHAGVVDWNIWRAGRDVISVVQALDFEQTLTEIDASAANQRWQLLMAEYVCGPYSETQSASITRLTPVWSFREQLSARARGNVESSGTL